MPFSKIRQVIHVDCPVCHWTRAVLAYENARKRCFLCPHCQHLWDTTQTAHGKHGRLNHRSPELRDEHATLKKEPFDQAVDAERRRFDGFRGRRSK
jgi:hypothetical protein